MKKLILLTSLCIYSCFMFSENKSTPGFYIAETKVLSSLNSNESQFEFLFFTNDNIELPKEIKMSCNGKNVQATLTKNSFILNVKPGKYKFQFYASSSYYEIYTDSIKILGKNKQIAHVTFQSSINPVIADKPVIYCYTEKPTAVKVEINPKGLMNYTYPIYKNAWEFIANKNGDLQFGNKTYNYLFWEAEIKINLNNLNQNCGYQIKKENLVAFFEEKLTEMNLNSKEIQDYITYWVPQMNESNQYVIQFLFNEEFEKYAPLTITPKPDNLFRVFMLMRPIENGMDLNLKPQHIKSANRNGFSVIEWGGCKQNILFN